MKRIAILVNKDFEYKGFIEGLRDTVPVYAGTNGRDAECRFDNLRADIFCIQNLFKNGENSSNSEVKYHYLKDLFKSNAFRIEDVDAVLSVSTSESTPDIQGSFGTESRNGCVYIGNRFFLSDERVKDPNTDSHLNIGTSTSGQTEYYFAKHLCDGLYEVINRMQMHFKPAYINSDNELRCFADTNSISIGVVNVMDYSCYKIADATAYADYWTRAYSQFCKPVCIETTHGVVVKAFTEACSDLGLDSDIPMTFISPIVDRYLKFDEDVDGKEGKQNFICSYNGGVATGHILEILNGIRFE